MNDRHGWSRTPEYRTWTSMLQRCTNPKNKGFKYYGGRGIKVCDRWRSFREFVSDMGLKPSPEHSIDRIDNDGDYTPGNCRWATSLEQAGNKRNSRPVKVGKVTSQIPTAEEIVSAFGGQTPLAEALDNLPGMMENVTYRTCSNWVARDRIPGSWLYPIYLVAKRRKVRGVTMTVLLRHATRGVMTEESLIEGAK